MKIKTLLFAGTALALSAPAFAQNHNHAMMDHKAAAALPQAAFKIEFFPQGALKAGDKTAVLMHITKQESGAPATEADFKIAHTRRLHLLVIDPTLEDYHHIHPVPTEKPGEWRFHFTPKKDGSYHIWTDVVAAASGQHDYIKTDIGTPASDAGTLNTTTNDTATVEGYTYALSFDTPLTAGQASMATLLITDKAGEPVKNLEPVMGAFAHIVAFGEDQNSLLHIHPMGKEPKTESEKGTSPLTFHIEPQKAGFAKMFIQTKINGEELFAPFGLQIK